MVPVLIAAEKEITGFAAVSADSIDENCAVVAAADVVPELDGFATVALGFFYVARAMLIRSSVTA